MASGFFYSSDITTTGTPVLITTTAFAKISTVNIRLANRSASPVKVRVAIGTGASPATKDYISYDAVIATGGIYEDTGFAVSAGEKVWVQTDTANISVRIHGMES